MLTSFFAKSSPINYLLLSLYLVSVFILQAVHLAPEAITMGLLLRLLLNSALLVFSMLLVDFFIRKNALSHSNTYGIFCFSTGVLFFPIAWSSEVLWSLFFILLGLRRMFSFHSGRNDVRKILDASIWFFVASYFYFWNILWFIPLLLAIISMKEPRFRYFFIPLLTGIGIFLIATAYFLIAEDSFRWIKNWGQEFSFNFTNYGKTNLLIAITILIAFSLWGLFYRFVQMPEVPKKHKAAYVLVFYVALVGVISTLLSPEKAGSELAFIVPGLALIIAGYLERDADLWLREMMMWVVLVLPIVLVFL